VGKNNDSVFLHIMKMTVVFTIVFTILSISTLPLIRGEDNSIKEGNKIKEIALSSNLLYKSRILLEKLDLLFTFNPSIKIKKALYYAEERIDEARLMLIHEKFDRALKFDRVQMAILESSEFIDWINENIKDVKSEDIESELLNVLTIEDNIKEYEFNLERLQAEIWIKGDKKWAEKMNILLEINRKKLKSSIENKKLKTVIKIKAVNGINQSEADKYIRELEKDYGMSEKKKNRVLRSLNISKAYIIDAKERLETAHDIGFNTDDLAGSLDKLQKEIEGINESIKPEQYEEEMMTIAEKSRNIAITIISENDEKRFEKELVEEAEKAIASIKEIKKHYIEEQYQG